MNTTDLPWPRVSGPTDPYDWDRVPYEIKRAAAGLPPTERIDLLDRLGDDPSLTTMSRIHPDGEHIGVVLDGTEVLEVPVVRLRGIDDVRLADVISRAISIFPENLQTDIRGELARLNVTADPDADDVTVRWGQTTIALVHRSHLVDGFQ